MNDTLSSGTLPKFFKVTPCATHPKFLRLSYRMFPEILKERIEIKSFFSCQVDLANALDLYYEDRFTLSDKILQCGAFIDFQDVPRSKVDF